MDNTNRYDKWVDDERLPKALRLLIMIHNQGEIRAFGGTYRIPESARPKVNAILAKLDENLVEEAIALFRSANSTRPQA